MFIQNLRTSTADCHHQLESNKLSMALLSNKVNKIIYCQYLSHLYIFVKGFEQFVYPMLQQVFLDINERKKSLFIEKDLAVYQHPIKEMATLQEPFFKEMYPDVYTAAGALYVLEGSTLGGQIILKHLQKTMSPDFKGSQYFSAYQYKTGSMWKSFLQQLTAMPQSIFNEHQMIAGAKKTFQIIDNILNNTP